MVRGILILVALAFSGHASATSSSLQVCRLKWVHFWFKVGVEMRLGARVVDWIADLSPRPGGHLDIIARLDQLERSDLCTFDRGEAERLLTWRYGYNKALVALGTYDRWHALRSPYYFRLREAGTGRLNFFISSAVIDTPYPVSPEGGHPLDILSPSVGVVKHYFSRAAVERGEARVQIEAYRGGLLNYSRTRYDTVVSFSPFAAERRELGNRAGGGNYLVLELGSDTP